MIIGIGHDLVELSRIQSIMEHGKRDRFLARVFTAEEIDQLSLVNEQRKIEYVAGRFAVKEAVSKAFGCGIGAVMSFQDIVIRKYPSGKPICVVEPLVLQRFQLDTQSVNIHVSITHERSIASAFVVVEEAGKKYLGE